MPDDNNSTDTSGWGSGLLSRAADGIGGFFSPGGKEVDPTTGLSEQMRKQAMFQTFGNLGALMMAAGQKQMPAQRAQILAQMGQATSGPQEAMMKQALLYQQQQARIAQQKLTQVQTAQAQQGLDQTRQLAESLKSPEIQKEIESWTPDVKAAANAAIQSGNAKIFFDLYERMQPKFQNGSVYNPKTNTLSDPYSGTIHLGGAAAAPPLAPVPAPDAVAPATTMGASVPAQSAFRSVSDIPQDVTGDDFLNAAGSLTPQMGQMALHAKRVIQGYDPMPTAGRGGATATYSAALQNMVRRADPTYDFTDPGARSKTRASFTTGEDAKSVASVNAALGEHGKGLYDLNARREYNTSVAPLNMAINAGVDNFMGDTDAAKVNAALANQAHKYGVETDKFLSGGNSTITGAANATAPYSSDKSKAVIAENLKTDADLMLGKMKPLIDKWRSGMGKNPGNTPPPMLSASSVAYLNELGLGHKIKEMGIPVAPGSPEPGGPPPTAGTTSTGSATGGTPTMTPIPLDAIKHLRQNPRMKDLFDQKYGEGSSSAILGN